MCEQAKRVERMSQIKLITRSQYCGCCEFRSSCKIVKEEKGCAPWELMPDFQQYQDEINALRQENAELRLIRDIIIKAAETYWNDNTSKLNRLNELRDALFAVGVK